MKTPTDVLIRAAEPGDYRGIKAIYEQPLAYANTLQMPLPSAESWQQRTAREHAGTRTLVACLEEVVIGHIGLSVDANPRRRHTGHIGMAVHDDHAGRGVGQQLMDAVLDLADNWLNVARVELTVYTDNERAIALYQRTGFEIEGTLRQYAYRHGEFVDAYSMARLR